MHSSSSKLFLCVDAGGTKTAACIAGEDGEVLARGRGDTANMAEVGISRSSAQIVIATESALRNYHSSLSLSNGYSNGNGKAINGDTDGHLDIATTCSTLFSGIWVGIAGCDTEKDVSEMSSRLQSYFQTKVSVVNDGLLLSSPILRNGCKWGVAVVAGTGSVTVGVKVERNGKVRQLVRRGGQGHMLGDFGSAYHLGLMAVKMAADDYDFGLEQPGGLADEVRRYYGVKSTADVPSRFQHLEDGKDAISAANCRKLRIAGLAPTVMKLYDCPQPCQLAIRVIRYCAKALAKDIAAVANQSMTMGCGPVEHATLCVSGGVIAQDSYRKAVIDELGGLGISFGWVEFVSDAAGKGACAIALSASGGAGGDPGL